MQNKLRKALGIFAMYAKGLKGNCNWEVITG
jgi:hypothetical protein